MRLTSLYHQSVRCAALGAGLLTLAGCGSDSTGPTVGPDQLSFTADRVSALDSTAHVILAANPGHAEIEALVDSTLLVLTAGVQAQRVDITTDLTTKPLYFIGIHRAISSGTSSYSTWTLIGLDDPSKLANLVEVSGFIASTTTTPPSTATGTIGDGTGTVNSMLLQVGTGGVVTEWAATSGSASFTSDAPGAACPGFTPTATVTCALETMHVFFSATAPSGTGGASARHASQGTQVDVPAMRLTYHF